MPTICNDKGHVLCWSLLLFETFMVQGLVSAAYYHFTTSEYTTKDIVFASIVIGLCTILLGSTILGLIIYRRHRRRNKEISRKATLKDENKLSQKMKILGNYYGSDCAICLEPKSSDKAKIVGLTCNHSFHKPCIKTSLLSADSSLCPICRQPPKKFTTGDGSSFNMKNHQGSKSSEDHLSQSFKECNQPLIIAETSVV